ncbi:MAG: UDP-N-acetylmuramoyl-L-alanyl-D-glutamate--2,6-diaminopimelate ligase [Ruminococcaceae bacterium]|nr:UDP-N-acetylmuramoyl-L-alanyl-D-glutamate--2,6-diaminopimelate ligase [Oscillospiraceae bacterium]
MLLTSLLPACQDYTLYGSPAGLDVQGIEYNSRYAGENKIFVCMPGARIDGHAYAPMAYEQGCRIFVCDHRMGLPEDAVQIVVETPRLTLALLSAAYYGNPADSLTVIGITGTKGKTTTAILLSEILSASGHPCAYIGSNGVTIGTAHYETVNTTPESRELHRYFRMMVDEGITHVVMEVSSQALKFWRVHGITFDTCLYTNLSEDHISPTEHPDFEEYKECKTRLFRLYGCRHIVCNGDDPYCGDMIRGADAEIIRYAIDSEAEFCGGNIRPFRSETALGIDFDCKTGGHSVPVRLRTPGDFSVYNGLCAIAAAHIYGVPAERCAEILKRMSIRGRFEIVDALDNVTFIIDYAHNGLSLESALSVLREYNPHRLICLIGTVGGKAQNRREELADAAGRLADYVIFTSDNPDREPPEDIIRDMLLTFRNAKPYEAIVDREEAVRRAVQMAQDGDIVLFAGKGHENYQLINGEKIPFSERDLILDEAAVLKEGLQTRLI